MREKEEQRIKDHLEELFVHASEESLGVQGTPASIEIESNIQNHNTSSTDLPEFEWDDIYNDDLEKRKILENELPNQFCYEIERFKVINLSQIPHENRFNAQFYVNICDEDEAEQFRKDLEKKTGTSFNKSDHARVGVKNWSTKFYKCTRNQRSRVNITCTEQTTALGAGSGHKEGTARQEGKDQNCKTKFTARLEPCNKDHSNLEEKCFKLFIKLEHNHTHEIEASSAWNFQEVREETR